MDQKLSTCVYIYIYTIYIYTTFSCLESKDLLYIMLDIALTFLEKQKLANCPCQVHTTSRGYDWIVFRRQPDRTPTLYYEQTESESEEEVHEEYEDDDYYSVEPFDLDNGEEKEDQNVTGAATSSEVPLIKQQTILRTSLNMKIKYPYTPGRMTAQMKKKKKRRKRSLRRSPLMMMKKTWNPRILMTLMNLWILQEEEGPTIFASSL